ncbi:uncharacterized protein LOC127729284 [Mytilus californianus]|uniref:uncharacterized protein LOC127729284 n=1 Tax=Mytilus californianus TaxID=6549 RepID=UPI002245AE18|nr:uncharacterized protein LOC127729284 [Mytilus californianus]XP_052092992.1 uncharacterized protein LOC127729284 [Mytilus californianus]
MFWLLSHVVVLMYHLTDSSSLFGLGVAEKHNCFCCSCWNADFSCTDDAVVVNVTLDSCSNIPKVFQLDILWYRDNMVSNTTIDELDVGEHKTSASIEIKRNWIILNVRISNVEIMITPMKCTEHPYCQCRPVQSGAFCKTSRHLLPEFQDKTTKKFTLKDSNKELTLEKNYIILTAVIVCGAVCVMLVSVMYKRNEMNRPVRRQDNFNNRRMDDGETVAMQCNTVTTS